VEAPDGDSVPEWDTADRMRKSLRAAGMGVQEMADYLGVARNTVSTWINGRIEPSTQTLRLWALRTGVPFAWLRDGKSTVRGVTVDSITMRCSWTPRRHRPRAHLAAA
jgi:transcriptional regulator with XRE-family HTH domain